LNQVKRRRLESILNIAPGVGSRVVPFIMHKWDSNSQVRDNPQELFNFLHQEAGLKPNSANSIVRDVFSVEEEYSDLLARSGIPSFFYRATPAQQYPPQYYGYNPAQYPWTGIGPQAPSAPATWPPSGFQGYPQYQYQPQQSPFVTREDFIKWTRESEETRKYENLRKEVTGLADSVSKVKGEILSALGERTPEGQFEEVREYIDKEGKICDPDKATSLRIRRVPVVQRGLSKEDVRDIIEESRGRISIEDVRKVVREERGDEKDKVTREELLRATEESAKKAVEAERDREDRRQEEERRHRETLEAIRTSRPPPTGVNTPEGVLATGIHEIGRREPVRILVEGAEKIIGTGPQAPPSTGPAGTEERGGVISELRKHGLVTVVRERVRG